MLRLVLAVALAVTALPAFSQSEKEKEVSCGYQSEVVDAVQKARIDNVKERDVKKKVLTSDKSWPDNYDAAVPLIAPWVYDLPMKQVRNTDLGDVWSELCLKQ